MSVDLYYTSLSSPSRMVLLAAAAVDLHLNLKLVNLRNGEHLTPEFLKLNPQHTVPTLVDGDFSLSESRAISRYLVNKYGGENNDLYPTDPKARAIIDQRLDFDLGTLYARFGNYFYAQVFGGAKADEAEFKKLQEALKIFNTFLDGQKYAAGDKLTLADLGLVASVSTIDAAGIVSLKDYPNVEKWFELVKSTAPRYQEVNEPGVKVFKDMVAQFKGKTEL